MTDRHNVIFHLLLAGMIAIVVSLLVDRHSLYDRLKYHYIHELHQEDDNPGKNKKMSTPSGVETDPEYHETFEGMLNKENPPDEDNENPRE